MSVTSGPKLVTDGLVFGYDAQDPKSFKGASATNQFAVPTPDGSNNVTFEVQGTGIFQRVYSGTYAGYSITNNDVVYRYDLTNAGGCYYHGNDTTITAGQWATFTFDYYISPGAANYPVTNYLANFEGVVSGAAADPTPSITGVWKTATFTAQAGSTGLCRMLLYPGACNGTSLANSGFILYKNPQVIISSASNTTAPFTGPFGARSSTQTLLDVTGRNTITTNSLTYNSTGTEFSFDGVDDYVTTSAISGLGTSTNSISWCIWTKPNGSAGNIMAMASANPIGNWNMPPIAATGSQFRGKIWNNNYLYSSTYTVGVWYYVCLVFNYDPVTANAYQRLYVNGELAAEQTNITYSSSGVNNFLFFGLANPGADNTGYYNGSIGAVQVYSGKALSQDEIKQNFDAYKSRYGL